jgi:hypothetical protein
MPGDSSELRIQWSLSRAASIILFDLSEFEVNVQWPTALGADSIEDCSRDSPTLLYRTNHRFRDEDSLTVRADHGFFSGLQQVRAGECSNYSLVRFAVANWLPPMMA